MLAVLGVLVGAAALAFFLRGLISEFLILPLARLYWAVLVAYRTIPQFVVWVILLGLLVFLTIGSFSLPASERTRERRSGYIRRGEVEQLAFWLKSGRPGSYSRWQVAHILAVVALDILRQRSAPGRGGQKLEGPGWNPPPDVQEYLQTALTTTYADYPRPGLFSRRPPTPFDRDPEPVIAYLESFLENNHEH